MRIIDKILFILLIVIKTDCCAALWKMQDDSVIPDFSPIQRKITDKVEKIEQEKCSFVKITLFSGSIIIYDVHPSKNMLKDYMKQPDSFLYKTLSAFLILKEDAIGNAMLDELIETMKNSTYGFQRPLVIFNWDFLKKVKEINGAAYDSCSLRKALPEAIRDDITVEALSTPWQKPPNWEETFNLLQLRNGMFLPKTIDPTYQIGFPNDTILLNFGRVENRKLTGLKSVFSKEDIFELDNDFSLALDTDILIEDDTTLFHELNHARHFMLLRGMG
ncbi:MAG: hypothetical protein LBF54_00350 [Holosporaceae bacterium]|jgi:hypothetical protein|nr:hypothetical protein [Holosporaceae bacterium]